MPRGIALGLGEHQHRTIRHGRGQLDRPRDEVLIRLAVGALVHIGDAQHEPTPRAFADRHDLPILEGIAKAAPAFAQRDERGQRRRLPIGIWAVDRIEGPRRQGRRQTPSVADMQMVDVRILSKQRRGCRQRQPVQLRPRMPPMDPRQEARRPQHVARRCQLDDTHSLLQPVILITALADLAAQLVRHAGLVRMEMAAVLMQCFEVAVELVHASFFGRSAAHSR
jgi:hypothetical protein